MESTGVLEAYSFFSQSIEHFIYGNIEADITLFRIGSFSWRLGLAMETYMGESWNSPEMKFNIYGGHWNIKTQFGYQLDPLLLRVYTDHECLHNLDAPAILAEYLNGNIGEVVVDDLAPEYSHILIFRPAGLPDG